MSLPSVTTTRHPKDRHLPSKSPKLSISSFVHQSVDHSNPLLQLNCPTYDVAQIVQPPIFDLHPARHLPLTQNKA
jgi:hypothetical protein